MRDELWVVKFRARLVAPQRLRVRLVHNHPRPDGDGAGHEQHQARAAGERRGFDEGRCDREGRARRAPGALACEKGGYVGGFLWVSAPEGQENLVEDSLRKKAGSQRRRIKNSELSPRAQGGREVIEARRFRSSAAENV